MHISRIFVSLLVCFLFAGNLPGYSPTRSYYKRSSRNTQEEDKRLELVYAINRVEMLYSARKKADKLIKSGKEKIKQGNAMRNARDYKRRFCAFIQIIAEYGICKIYEKA